MEGTTLDGVDTESNSLALGGPAQSFGERAAVPRWRRVALVELAPLAIFATKAQPAGTVETPLAGELLGPGCMPGRCFLGDRDSPHGHYARRLLPLPLTLLWRITCNAVLDVLERPGWVKCLPHLPREADTGLTPV